MSLSVPVSECVWMGLSSRHLQPDAGLSMGIAGRMLGPGERPGGWIRMLRLDCGREEAEASESAIAQAVSQDSRSRQLVGGSGEGQAKRCHR